MLFEKKVGVGFGSSRILWICMKDFGLVVNIYIILFNCLSDIDIFYEIIDIVCWLLWLMLYGKGVLFYLVCFFVLGGKNIIFILVNIMCWKLWIVL